MRIAILGPLELQRNVGAEPPAGRRVAALLARLALDCGRVVSASALIDAVWDDELPADPAHALQTLVSRLRRLLGGDVLVAEAGGYRLALDPGAVDATAFERLAAQGAAALREDDAAGASELLGRALALWRGPALGGLADEHRFATAAAARLDDLRLEARAGRIGAELALGRGAQLVGELEALLAEHPLDERLAAHQLAALAAAGRPADALAAYERMRRRLDEELGAIPSPELQAAHAAVLRGDGAAPVRALTNLPHARSSFVGREQEVAGVDALLDHHRLVTLVGTGGAGKTRLAVEVGRRRLARVRDGVWIAELAAVTDPLHVTGAVLDALGRREVRLLESGAPLPLDAGEQLLGALAGREALLVLDNCEHVIGAAAALADDLLAGCPGLRVLATGREPLAITGERLLAVSPLGLPSGPATAAEALAHPSIVLLADRGAAASPGFAVDEDNVDAVVEICRRLDGLPLAIELAAARLRSLSPAQIAVRLDDRFRLLTGGSRTALPRQRTLRAVIDWSWQLLSERERRLAERIAVFPAGVTPESAAAVDGGEADEVLDLLAALVDRSLLQVADPGAPRYRMLETLREYGIDRLAEAGELDAVRTAQARHFAALAEEADPHLRRPEQREWLARLLAERENLMAALRFLCDAGDARRALRMAVSTGWFWLLAGSTEEATAEIRLAAAVPGDADPVDRIVAEALAREPDEHSAEELQAVIIGVLDGLEAEGFDSRPLLVAVAPLLAMVGGQPERSERLFEAARAHPDPWVRASVPFALAQMTENEGDVEGTRGHLREALDAFRAVGDRWALGMSLLSWGTLRTVDGALDDAAAALEEAHTLLVDLNEGADQALLLLRLADLRARQGDVAGARELAARARRSGGAGGEQAALGATALARIAVMAGDLPAAQTLLDELAASLEALGGTAPGRGHARALVLTGMAALALALDDRSRARECLELAYPAAASSQDMPILASVGVVVAEALAAAGRDGAAAEALGAAARLRGAEDATAIDVARLTAALREALGDDLFAAAFARGRALDRDAAIARLDPAAPEVPLRAPPVGP